MSTETAKKPQKPPFFTLITVTKNNLTGLKSTQSTIEHQTCRDFEWVIIDGASADDTPAHLKTLNAYTISEPDDGIYDAMNKGIKRSNGGYLLFLNAGDTLAAPNTLEHIKTAAKSAKTQPNFIYGDAIENTGKNNAKKPARYAKIAYGMFTHHQSMLYHRASLADLRYNLDYKIAADYDLTARFLKLHKNTLYCPIPICNFEPGGLSQTNADLGRAEQFQIRKKLKLTGPIHNQVIWIGQKTLWLFRRVFPNLYWHLKSAQNQKPV